MPEQNRVLLVLSRRSYRAGAFLEAASASGYPVTLASDHGDTLTGGSEGLFLPVDLLDTEGAVEEIVRFHQRFPLSAILAAEDEGQEIAAQAAEALGLAHNRPLAVRAARRKDVMREALERAGLRGPQYWIFDTSENPRTVAKRVAFPAVLKPTFLSASRGVIRADDTNEFEMAWTEIKMLLTAPAMQREGGAAARRILVEEYIEGDEFALEGLLSDGDLTLLALFDKPDPLTGPVFEETIYVTPSRASQAVQDAIRDEARLAVRAVGLGEGPVHIECRVNAGGVFVIDMAPRSIGGYCSKALRFGEGRSLEEVILRAAMGESLEGLEREAASSGVMMIPIPRPGVLHGVYGLEEARNWPDVTEIILSIRPGQIVIPLPRGGQYLGFIFARASTPGEVENSLRAAHELLEFDIR
ncbi:MAG: ATP-grasp domain-containing protein [Chloroflexi bacterium]|nr:ATP-grasp domain-containing protein [Chloroflexota bacterium]